MAGPGALHRPPIALHTRLPLRVAFGTVNVLLLLAALLGLYAALAWGQYAAAAA
jgi:hypothetical protein